MGSRARVLREKLSFGTKFAGLVDSPSGCSDAGPCPGARDSPPGQPLGARGTALARLRPPRSQPAFAEAARAVPSPGTAAGRPAGPR